MRILKAGDILGERFLLEHLLGSGSFAAVYRARDLTRDPERVAVKVLFPDQRDRENEQRFAQEAEILAGLDHPNLARFVAFGQAGDDLFLAMELVDGEPLSARLDAHAGRDRLLPLEAARWLMEHLTSAVECLHRRSIVHRDLKPRNIMVNRRGQRPRLKVLDFGIAKLLEESSLEPTTMGRVVGTLNYVSPEQLIGKPVDTRADIFSLGVMLFEVLTLRRTWARDAAGAPLPWRLGVGDPVLNNHVALSQRILSQERPRVSAFRTDVSPRIDAVLARALALEPEERFASAEDFARAAREALLGVS